MRSISTPADMERSRNDRTGRFEGTDDAPGTLTSCKESSISESLTDLDCSYQLPSLDAREYGADGVVLLKIS